MLYLICPNCGEILGNKQIVYEEEMKKICDEMNIDFNMVSLGFSDKEGEYKEKRAELVNALCENRCCKELIINYIDIVHIIKG
jgi:hypothetical protein